MIKGKDKINESKENLENYYLIMNKLMQLLVGFMFIVTIVGAVVRVMEGMATKAYLILAIVIFILTELLAFIVIKKEPNSIKGGYINIIR